MPRVEAPDHQAQLVAVRADKREATVDLRPPAPRERRPKPLFDRVSIRGRERHRRALAHVFAVTGRASAPAMRTRGNGGHETFQEPQATTDELRAGLHELFVEHVEGEARVVVAHPGPQQRVALFQHPLVVGTRRVVARGQHGQQFVEELAPFGGPALTSARSSGANTVTRNRPCRSRARVTGLPVALDPVAARDPDLGLEQLRALAGRDFGPHDRLVAPARTSIASVTPPKRPGPRHPSDRLEQARFSLPVRALQHRQPGASSTSISRRSRKSVSHRCPTLVAGPASAVTSTPVRTCGRASAGTGSRRRPRHAAWPASVGRWCRARLPRL